jgi:hypothetical protein
LASYRLLAVFRIEATPAMKRYGSLGGVPAFDAVVWIMLFIPFFLEFHLRFDQLLAGRTERPHAFQPMPNLVS